MVLGVNKVILIGNLGGDPEVRYMPSGTAVANFSIAVSEVWKDKQTGEKQERTEWVRTVAYGRLGEIAGDFLRKGSQVYIEGKLQTRKWLDKNNLEKVTTEVIANDLQMLDRRKQMGQHDQGQEYQTKFPSPRSAPNEFGHEFDASKDSSQNIPRSERSSTSAPKKEVDFEDDDIPF